MALQVDSALAAVVSMVAAKLHAAKENPEDNTSAHLTSEALMSLLFGCASNASSCAQLAHCEKLPDLRLLRVLAPGVFQACLWLSVWPIGWLCGRLCGCMDGSVAGCVDVNVPGFCGWLCAWLCV